MTFYQRARKLLPKTESLGQNPLVCPISNQVRSWHKANRKMGWGIKEEEFNHLTLPNSLMEQDWHQGAAGIGLFYGFGESGSGHSDPVLSGKVSWEYALKSRKRKTWQCEYVSFYDVAPYGHNDFFDAVQLFCSNGTLGLGIGNVDRIYPGFGVPTLHLLVPMEEYNRLSPIGRKISLSGP